MLQRLTLALTPRTKKFKQPLGCGGNLGTGVNAPAISGTTRVKTWGRQHITTIATGIESGANGPRGIADRAMLTKAEIAMSALAGDNLDSGWQCAVLRFEIA